MPFPLAVLVSGSGSNLQSILDKIEAGAIDAEIRVVLSNKPDAYGLVRARNRNVATWSRPHTDFPSRQAFDAEMVRVLNDHGIAVGQGAVVLAGFMRMLTPEFLRAFPQAVVNIHPALLPSFPGTHGAADAADYGVRLAGCSVHFVDEIMDHGPVIIQAAVPALPDDDHKSLAARILKLEHCIYPQAVSWLAQGRLSIDGRHVRVSGAHPASLGDAAQPYLTSPGLEPGFLPQDV
ncbi:MAG: phosphoribosylglycinamide formyltransferase [Humidesulfovibrio sp.]|uniref:phosphoribosylglycinamide formyltransferase n=1 Tax=Humidesulfovibrio sp. TaxID=2910988 RepID=UPI0027E66013|nr:phosphoribosylglycinamide formyltransferase [Humidesulfovibrio sp.]MDQ7836810.1 phosphoribosylglycinamide formyltransferase [Humidesulfovibrio sp.]